jgi:hypothetical protein
MSSVLQALSGPAAPRPINYPSQVVIAGILNTHTHPRGTDEDKDGRAEMHIPLWAEVAHDILAIGNTVPPLTTTALAEPQKERWQAIVPPGRPLRIHVAGLITEHTDPADVVAGYDRPDGEEVWLSMKMFIRSASNAHGADVDDVSKMIPVLRAMTETKFIHKKRPMALSLHLERKWDSFGNRVHFLNRERESMKRDLLYLLQQVPEAHLIICHVSDAATIELIRRLRSLGYNVWGELCPTTPSGHATTCSRAQIKGPCSTRACSASPSSRQRRAGGQSRAPWCRASRGGSTAATAPAGWMIRQSPAASKSTATGLLSADKPKSSGPISPSSSSASSRRESWNISTGSCHTTAGTRWGCRAVRQRPDSSAKTGLCLRPSSALRRHSASCRRRSRCAAWSSSTCPTIRSSAHSSYKDAPAAHKAAGLFMLNSARWARTLGREHGSKKARVAWPDKVPAGRDYSRSVCANRDDVVPNVHRPRVPERLTSPSKNVGRPQGGRLFY